MRALTSSYSIDDPHRFNFGTPSQAWSTMVRCWTIEPTSERIIADIFDFPNVLQIVIDHKGAVVPEINLRHGHRALAINGGRVLKRKITSRQRKHLLTMGPIHHHAQRAINNLLRFGRLDALEQPLDENEIAEAIAEEEGALNQIQDILNEDDDDSDSENDNLELNVAVLADIASGQQVFL